MIKNFLTLYNRTDSYIRKLAETYIIHCSKFYFQIFLMFVIATIFFLFFSTKLKLITNFEALLPDNSDSVKVLNEYVDRMGGVNRLIVGVETENFEQGKKFVEDLVVEVNKLPKGIIKYLDYNINKIKDYYTDNFLFYMDKPDLEDLNSRVEKKIKYEKKKHSPFNLNLLDEEPAKEEIDDFSIDDLKERYKKNTNSKSNQYKDGYYTNVETNLLAVTIVPFGSNLSFDKAKEINETIENIISQLDPKKYSSDMTVQTAGNMKSRVEENEAVKNDIVSTVLLVLSLVALSIYLFFMSVSVILILITTLSFAVIWAMGLAYLQIGHLNYQTAFMTSLIVGTGVNYGIIFIYRYLEELEKGKDCLYANIIALQNTYMSTLLASLTTVIAFLSLYVAKNNGFADFGFIGSIGISLTWLFTMLLIPNIIFIFNKFSLLRLKPRKVKIGDYIAKVVVFFLDHFRIYIAIASLLFLCFGMYKFYYYFPNALESNFSKLRNKESTESGTKVLTDKLNKIFPRSLTPSVILTDSIDEAEMVCSKIENDKIINPDGPARTVGDCYTIFSILPKDQKEKLPLVKNIKSLLYDRALQWMDDKDYEEIVDIRNKIKKRYLTIEDLPFDMKKNFMEKNGDVGKMAYVDQNKEFGLIHRQNLKDYASTINNIELENGKLIKSSGEWIIFDDLLETVKNDIPIVSLFAFIGVSLATIFLLGSIRSSLVVMFSMLFSISSMLGFIAIVDMKINFFNFIALPLTLGLGVDYSLNIYARYRIENFKNFNKIILNTGSAVILCSLTTIISYITLMPANSQALASFGKLALVGEITSIFTALFIMPILSHLIIKKGT